MTIGVKKVQQIKIFDVVGSLFCEISIASRNRDSKKNAKPIVLSPSTSSTGDLIADFIPSDSMIFNKLKPITPSDLYVSCTVFDRLGNITAVSRKYPKMQFLKDNHLFPRDLRKIDTSSIEVVPVIMIRPSTAILVNLLHIKAIIKKDSVMVFDTSNSEIATKLGIFMYDLELKLKSPSNNICYEFRALESILVSIMSYLEAEIKVHRRQCGLILAELEDEVDRQKLQELLVNSKKLSSFHQRAILIRDVLEELLDNDEDLAGMYLTDPKNVSDPEEGNYEEIESILESYYRQCDEFVQQAGSLLNDIKATEEIVNIILDANRNSLMLFELKVTVYTLGFTVATLLPAFYGMNLKNYIEESNWGFIPEKAVNSIDRLIERKMLFGE
ncbi:Inner membrane magnesium transporter MRS2, mitochondrial [Candida maltosa Xu316]|uniref:Magnesium transporter n=1 Tax=Candida maltosa (strain Xu316) TaxID=1245528 RepID=M3JRA3_CANMX|nr:Inner membrane magnesium transporter MRS2, mitochondrial [Candida maltosa Xu316]